MKLFAVLPRLRWRKQFWEVFFGKLLTCLSRLLYFLSNDLPFAVLVLLDRIEKRGALVTIKLGIMHVLIPVLLNAALGAIGKRLGNLCPTVALVPHLFETQLLLWRPWGIGAALLGRRGNRRAISTVR